MTNESLSHFLYKSIKEETEDEATLKQYLSDLIYNGKKTSDAYDKKIVKALHSIRVLDPACGSGAFPMGMLQRIVDILRIVDPKSDAWLELMLEPIDDIAVREQFRKQLTGSRSDYQRKLGIIRNCIYAIDIQPIAVQITKLRFFISLLADQEIDTTLPNSGIMPFPNMETKIVCADSLKNIHANFFIDKAKEELVIARQNYYQPNISPAEREKIADDIADILDETFSSFAVQIGLKQVSNKAVLKHWFIDANINAPFFDMGTFFPELKDGFDIVIGNPPYGGFKIATDVRENLSLGSNDPYGAFIARFLGNGSRVTPLKDGGMLAFIVSDTFMTIGSHLDLRKQMMHNRIHKMIRMSPKTFSATVNTVTIFCEKCKDLKFKDDKGKELKRLDIDGNVCTMADMTNIDIHEDFAHFVGILSQSMSMDTDECISNEEYAIYRYPQTLILNCSNLPFFVASPKLFGLMQDENLQPEQKQSMILGDKHVGYRVVNINGNEVQLFRLGEISEVKQGLATGDNDSYFYQMPEARGTYRNIEDFEKYILTETDMKKIHDDDQLRLSLVEKGIAIEDCNSSRYFGGRYIARYEKGAESDSEEGWMPNYHVPTEYFIDWSEWAVNRMKTLTKGQRDKEKGLLKVPTNPNRLCSRFQNSSSYFQQSIAYSMTGVYAPTYRISEGGPYDHKSSGIFLSVGIIENIVGILTSKLQRYLQRTMINHTVEFGIDDTKNIPVILNNLDISGNVCAIIANQKNDRYYDYASHEQLEIDRLVYEAYGLNDDDIREVETWYARRYPKLAAAQRSNLEKVRKGEA